MSIVIEIPGVSPPIPALTIDSFLMGEGYQRSMLNLISVGGYSQYGTPEIQGALTDPRYTWQISAHLTENEALQLDALAKWQDSQYKAKLDGKLQLTDQMEYLPPEASPHSRTLLSALNPSWNAGYEYGYGVFDVAIAIPEQHRTHAGVIVGTTDQVKLVQFGMVEV